MSAAGWRALFLGLLILVPVAAMAGNTEPPAAPSDPASAMPTLEDLYQRLVSGNDYLLRTVFAEPAAGPGPTGHTLQQVMDAAPAADNATGATTGDVLAGKMFWGLRTDGAWGPQAGTQATRTLSDATTTVEAGYYAATTLDAVDPDLATANVRAGVTLFGVAGDPDVVVTSTGSPAEPGDLREGRTAFANGSRVDGAMATRTLSPATTTVLAGYYAGTTLDAVDPDLATGNVRSGVNVFGVAGDPGVVNTSTGTPATPPDLLVGRTAFANGSVVVGSMPVRALSDTTTAVPAGYYAATTLDAVDADLATANIRSGATIFGVAGDPNVVSTSSGDAVAADLLTAKRAWVDGAEITGTRSPAPVGKTGQVRCFNASGTVIPCAGTGQDGDLTPGVAWPNPRFTDNGNGTVTDNLSGLIWLKSANCNGQKTWANALTWANGLYDGCPGCGGTNNDCGLTDGSVAGDWRLPSRFELESVLDLEYVSPALSNAAGTAKWSEGNAFSGVQSSSYWSASSNAFNPSYAWDASLYYGIVYSYPKTTNIYVWPVRGGR
jgi:hypothetical protein